MTVPDHTPAPPPHARALVAAFLDGEPVDPAALDRALADPDGRAYLIDTLALRRLVGVAEAVTAVDAPADAAPAPQGRWWSLAAAIAVVSVLGGYFVGRVTPDGLRSPADGGRAPTPVTATTLDAPEPTEVIRFEPGVDWEEEGGREGGRP